MTVPPRDRGAAVYSADQFDRATVQAVVTNLGRVLGAICADPGVAVGDLAMPGAEPLVGAQPQVKRTLTEILTATAATYPDNAGTHRRRRRR